MDNGITQVRCDGIPSVRRVNALEVLRYFVKSFVPPETLPTVSSTAHGIFQPVLIVVQIMQCDSLRANVPAAERVVFVTADVQTLALSVPSDIEMLDGLFVRIARRSVEGDGCAGFAERILNSDFDSTYRFAEIAVAIMN